MYAVYQSAIKKYIIKKMVTRSIEVVDGISKLKYMVNYADLEPDNTYETMLCIEYMMGFFNIVMEIVKDVDKQRAKIYIYCGSSTIVVSERIAKKGFSYYLNEYPIYMMDNNMQKRSLLSFLVDPLQFVNKNIQEISDLDDVSVRSFLFGLKNCADNMEIMHIKLLLATQIKLVDDINKLIGNKYIDLLFDRERLKEIREETIKENWLADKS